MGGETKMNQWLSNQLAAEKKLEDTRCFKGGRTRYKGVLG